MVPRQERCERFPRGRRPRVASDGDQRRPRGGAAPPPAPRRAGRLRRDAWVVAASGRAALRAAKLKRARESQTGMACNLGQAHSTARESIGPCAGRWVSQGVRSLTARIGCGVAACHGALPTDREGASRVQRTPAEAAPRRTPAPTPSQWPCNAPEARRDDGTPHAGMPWCDGSSEVLSDGFAKTCSPVLVRRRGRPERERLRVHVRQ